MSNASHISLHRSRLQQLRDLAASTGTTVSETINRLISEKIEAGELPDTVPGFEVSTRSGGVVMRLDKLELPAFDPKSAADLADDLQMLVDTQAHPGRTATFPAAGKLVFARRGTGFTVAYTVGGVEIGRKTATRGILLDVARNLRTAALDILRTH